MIPQIKQFQICILQIGFIKENREITKIGKSAQKSANQRMAGKWQDDRDYCVLQTPPCNTSKEASSKNDSKYTVPAIRKLTPTLYFTCIFGLVTLVKYRVGVPNLIAVTVLSVVFTIKCYTVYRVS